jgi:hypothetical protein
MSNSAKQSAAKRYWIELGRRTATAVLLGVLFCAFYVAVCSGGPSPVAVSGVVLYNGQPVPNVNVVLIGKGNATATGTTDAQGRFARLTTNSLGDGAFPGRYSVGLAPVGPQPSEAAPYQVPPPPPFPARYLSADTSQLFVVVEPTGTNNFVLELHD